MFNGVRNFVEGEPHLTLVTGFRLGMLRDALGHAGVDTEHRRIIDEEVRVLLRLHVYLFQRATRRLLDGSLPGHGNYYRIVVSILPWAKWFSSSTASLIHSGSIVATLVGDIFAKNAGKNFLASSGCNAFVGATVTKAKT